MLAMLELYIGRAKAGTSFYYRGRAYEEDKLAHDVESAGWTGVVRIMRKLTRGAPIRPIPEEPVINGIMLLAEYGYEPLSAREYGFLERKIDKLSRKSYDPRREDDELRKCHGTSKKENQA